MTKLKTDIITGTDLLEFLNSYSDFSFEISVLNRLPSQGFECEHGGSYEDPFTNKPREFDLRATKSFGQHLIRLAVECKNLRPFFPLLISCLPRREEESFHEVAFSVDPSRISLSKNRGPRVPAFEPRAKSIRVSGVKSIYKPGAFVGKSSDQVGRNRDGAITASDSDVYSKWAQAISSAQELTDRACYDGENRRGDMYLSLILPVLVVPDGTLWTMNYDSNGAQVGLPQQTSRCPYFIQMLYFGGDKLHGMRYEISHLEFVTLTGLSELIEDLSGNEAKLKALFSVD